MWRLANYIYRAFRNVTIHRCPQDILVPITTISNQDEEKNHEEDKENLIDCKKNIYQVIENNKFSSQNLEKVQEYLHRISQQQFVQKSNILKPIELPKLQCIAREIASIQKEETLETLLQTNDNITNEVLPIQQEETLESLLQTDQVCSNTLKSLSDLNNETMSIINNQLALEAIETGDAKFGIETLEKDGKNAAGLYNLGICYERGIGVEKDHAKACDYYRQASMLGHINAQFNLTILSNHIDINENEDEKIEQTVSTNKSRLFRLSFTNDYKEEPLQSWNDYHFNLTKTLSCLS